MLSARRYKRQRTVCEWTIPDALAVQWSLLLRRPCALPLTACLDCPYIHDPHFGQGHLELIPSLNIDFDLLRKLGRQRQLQLLGGARIGHRVFL